MDTLEREKIGLNNIEVEGDKLLTLLEGVSTHSSKDKTLITLNTVQVEGGGGLFTARANDRYRLIEGSAKALDGQLDTALISLEDIKRIITLLKSHKGHLISLTRLGDALTVSALGDAITFTVLDNSYPPFNEIFDKAEAEPIAVEGIAFNPAFMADYSKIAGKGEAIKIYFNGENKPMRVRITGDAIVWRALLMPMRYKD